MKSRKTDCTTREIGFYLALLDALYSDIASAKPASVKKECARDMDYIRSRVHTEGVSFLTKTLPSYGKAIDTALSSGTPLQANGFAKIRSSQLPRLLGWLLKDVFLPNGEESPDSSPIALRSLRQLLYLFYKLELPFDHASVTETLQRFKDTEVEMATFPPICTTSQRVLRIARRLTHLVTQEHDPRDIIPKHGPGAVATGERPWEKTVFKRFYPELNACYEYSSHMYFSPAHFMRDRVLGDSNLEYQVAAPLSKVVLVPKDSRGPRLISMEPLELQWIQQGVKDVLQNAIETHRLTRGHVNFTDQTVNQRLAMRGSIDPNIVTLDMKDASDRVSLAVVQMLFPENWVECLESCRSHGTVLPDGDVVQFNKFAPMGSALCFPVEALVFWALSVASIMDSTHISAWQAAKQVYVYGDDIIVPRKVYRGMISTLEDIGLKFNTSKCCTGPSFRESCGVDAYKGVNVTPLRVKRRWSHRLLPVQSLASYVSLSNRLHSLGYDTAAEFLEKELQSRYVLAYTAGAPTAIQFVRPNLDIRRLNLAAGVRVRLCRNTHRPIAKCHRIRPIRRSSSTDYGELLARWCQSKRSERRVDAYPGEYESTDHGVASLEAGRYSIPHRVSSEWGWAAVTF